MSRKEKKELNKKCAEEDKKSQRGVSKGDIPLLAFDSRNPENSEIGKGWGQHKDAALKVLNKIDTEDWEIIENYVKMILNRRIWRGIIYSLPEFQSKIVRLYVDLDDPEPNEYLLPSEKEEGEEKKQKYFLKRLGGIWQFFKEQHPDWIMVDVNGNPLEEALREQERVERIRRDQEEKKEAEKAIHNQEVGKISAMTDAEREEFIKQTLEDVRSRYSSELLLVDSENPDVYSVSDEGYHEFGMAKVKYISDCKKIGMEYKEEEEVVPIEYADAINPELKARLIRGTLHNIKDFESIIVKLYLQINDPSIQDLPESKRTEVRQIHLEKIKNICQYFKEKYPKWIMIDMNGNILESVLAE